MEQTIAILRIALAIITDRLLTIFSLVMTFTLSAWAMHSPDPEREGMAAFFALAVFIPSLIKERRTTHAPAPRVQAEAD